MPLAVMSPLIETAAELKIRASAGVAVEPKTRFGAIVAAALAQFQFDDVRRDAVHRCEARSRVLEVIGMDKVDRRAPNGLFERLAEEFLRGLVAPQDASFLVEDDDDIGELIEEPDQSIVV